MKEQLLTVSEASDYLNTSASTVYRYSKRRMLPHFKTGFGLRFKIGDLDEFLHQYKREAFFNSDILELNGPLTIPFAGYIDKAKGGKSKLTKKGQTCINYGFGSVYSRKTKSGIVRWYIYYHDSQGVRVRKVAKNARSREEAQKELREMVFREHYVDSTEKREPNTKFEMFAQLYLENYSKVKKRAWEKSDKVYLNANLIPFFGNNALEQIDMMLIEQFIAKRLGDNVQKSTINRDLACLRKILNKAVDWNYLKENPAAKVKLFSEKDNLRTRILTEEEERKLLIASSEHLKPILIMALNTGMRRGEILNLKWSQVDLMAKQIRVENTKSGEARIVPINRTLHAVLQILKRKQQNPFVFSNSKTGKPFTSVKTAFNAACRRANIEGLWLHDLRRTFATRILQKGADIETVKSLLGHHSFVVTQRYIHSDKERKINAVELLQNKKEKASSLTHLRHMKVSSSIPELPTHLFSVN